MKEIKYTILYRVLENFCDSILLRFRDRNYLITAPVPATARSVIKLWFRFRYGNKLRSRFRNTANPT
jgi:hypothetical protein